MLTMSRATHVYSREDCINIPHPRIESFRFGYSSRYGYEVCHRGAKRTLYAYA